MDAMKIANSIPMWLACALPVAFVILQAVLFARGAYKSGKKLGLNDKQMKKAMKSSAVTSIGPSIVVLSAMLSLLVSVGGPIGWMRLSMIGSVMFESIAAGEGRLDPAVMITHIGGIDAQIDTILNLPKIPGGKKLMYLGKNLELTAIEDFEEKGKTDDRFKELAKITKEHNGLWSKEAEDYLLANF